MRRGQKWMVAAGVLAALVGALGLALALLVPSDDELAAQAAAELQSRLGVPVRIGSLRWQLMPVPAVVLRDVRSDQAQAITVKQLTAYPDLRSLLDGRLKLYRADLEGAVLPQLALRELNKGPDAANLGAAAIPLERLVFRDVTWISRFGRPLVVEGEVEFDPNWRPRQAQLRRPGVQPVADLTLTRQGQEDRWTTRINLGGGTVNGEMELQTRANGRLHLAGALQPRGVEVAAAMAAFDRHSVVSGKASGETAVSADGATVGELAQTLHTKTSFTMGRDTLLRMDVQKTIRSLGKERSGQTPLDSVTGQLDTQNTPKGMVVSVTGIRASSGVLTASGKARIASRQIDGEFAVDLVEGLVGVPLQLSGPLEKVEVSVPRSAIAGAVIGTAVLPGVGTAIGARIGATLGKLFSSEPERKNAPPAAKPP